MYLLLDSKLLITPLPIGRRSIVMTVSVCLSVREHISGTTHPIFTKFLCVLPVAVTWSSYGSVARIPRRQHRGRSLRSVTALCQCAMDEV